MHHSQLCFGCWLPAIARTRKNAKRELRLNVRIQRYCSFLLHCCVIVKWWSKKNFEQTQIGGAQEAVVGGGEASPPTLPRSNGTVWEDNFITITPIRLI